jgi:hypothetical protein
MDTCEGNSSKQFHRRKTLQHYRVEILFFQSAVVIQYANLHAKWQNLEERLKIIKYNDFNGAFRTKEKARDSERNIDRVGARAGRNESDKIRFESLMDASLCTYSTTNDTYTSSETDLNYSNFMQINGNESFLWQGAQSRLCTHINRTKNELKS